MLFPELDYNDTCFVKPTKIAVNIELRQADNARIL